MLFENKLSISKCCSWALLAFCCLLLGGCSVLFVSRGRALSPYDFGLSQAHSGIERYYVLYNTHKAAVEAGVNVDYSGIKRIDLDIPAEAKSVPLTEVNDFKGGVFNVTNTSKHHFLFTRKHRTPLINNKGRLISNLKKQTKAVLLDASGIRATAVQ